MDECRLMDCKPRVNVDEWIEISHGLVWACGCQWMSMDVNGPFRYRLTGGTYHIYKAYVRVV